MESVRIFRANFAGRNGGSNWEFNKRLPLVEKPKGQAVASKTRIIGV